MPPPVSRPALLRPRTNPFSSCSIFFHIQTYRPPPPLPPPQTRLQSTTTKPTKKTSEPLRILFCGSDTFSCVALRALYDLHERSPSVVESIDVLVRPGKPQGRGLKRIAVGPLFHLAHELGLPVHQRDTFTGWTLPLPVHTAQHGKRGQTGFHQPPASGAGDAEGDAGGPQPLNLIVAVSFGLFVPPRILKTVRYGGINIHPSLLPDLRGPAPLQHAIIVGRSHAGVTLQTLHQKDFDRGDVLSQTPLPGIPVPEGCSVQQLHDLLASEGASLLVRGLEECLHVPPYDRRGWRPTGLDRDWGLVRDAPKVTKLDSEVDWGNLTWGCDKTLYPRGWTASDLERRYRAVGVRLAGNGGGRDGLWTHALTTRQPEEKRVILEDVEAVRCPDKLRDVVLAITQSRFGGRPAASKETEVMSRAMDGVMNVVFSMKDHHGPEHKAAQFRLPLMVDDSGKDRTSVIIPIRVPYTLARHQAVPVESGQLDAIRIRRIKVEGSKSRPAAQALAEFMERKLTLEDMSSLTYAVNTMAQLCIE